MVWLRLGLAESDNADGRNDATDIMDDDVRYTV